MSSSLYHIILHKGYMYSVIIYKRFMICNTNLIFFKKMKKDEQPLCYVKA